MMYLKVSKRLIRFFMSTIVIVILSGCGQGDGPQKVAGTPLPPSVGVLIDSPVAGVTWKTSGGVTGTTNARGEFDYFPLETVTFSIGDVVLGTATGAPFITVVELTGSADPAATAATNMLVFLQSLDEDSDPINGITISAATAAMVTGISIDFSANDFATQFASFLATVAGTGKEVVSVAAALNHFYTTYASLNGTDTFNFAFPGYPPVGGGADIYQLVFADEFDSGDVPSTDNWTIETGYGSNNDGWGNNEWQLYTNDAQNVRVEDGNLVLSALCPVAPCGIRDGTITSGKINSLNKFNFKFGKVVARIKPPVGKGAWPAFWALGANHPDVGWPLSGEIDFMEMHNAFSNDRTTHSTLHWCDDSIQAPAACSFPDGWVYDTQNRTFQTSLGDAFHVWEADWNADRITVSLDGVPYFSRTINAATMDEFLKEFYMILNIAMGGTLGNNNQPPDGTEIFPQTMLVDYVRVFQNTGGSSSTGFKIDFEDAPDTYSFSDFGGGAAAVIANPESEGINTSSQVVRMLKFDGEVFAGSKLILPTALNVPSGSTFTMKVWSPREVPVLLKFEGQSEAERSVTHTGSGWEELTFDFGTFSDAADAITVIFDLGIVGDATGDPDNWTFYFDDITLLPPDGGGGPGITGDLEIDFEDSPDSYNFGLDGGFGGGAAAVIANPESGGINTSAQVARMLKFSGEVFAGSALELPQAIEVVSGTSFTMKVWSPRAVMVLLKLEGPTEAEVNLAHGGTGWEELTFDFGLYAGSVEAITLIFDLGIVGDATGDPDNWTFYFDDITQVPPDGGGPGGDPGSFDFESAPAGYNFGVDGGFGGGAAAVIANPVSGGINTSAQVVRMLKFSGEVFAGSMLTFPEALDVPLGRAFTMKVWSPRPVMVLLKLEGANEIELNLPHGGTGWEELTYDFSSFSGSIDGVSVIFDLGTVGDAAGDPDNWTFYFDDIMMVPFDGGGGGPDLSRIDLPITFDDVTVDYTVVDFGMPAAVVTSVVADPQDSTNMVASTIKPTGAPTWAGTTMSTTAGFASAIPFTASVTTIGIRVYSPNAGIPVRLKAEDAVGGFVSVETEVLTTVANEWETLVFDFADHIIGTTALDLGVSYTALSVFFNFGTDGDTAGARTYLWDDVEFGVEPVGDITAPILTAVSITSSNANPALATIGDVITVSLSADEPLMTPTVLIGGTTASVTGADAAWTATRTLTAADADGSIALSITYSDLADNAGAVVTTVSDNSAVSVDATAPGIIISGAPTTLTFSTFGPLDLTFQFDEPVSDFDVNDIVVSNGMASSFASVDTDTYTATVTPNGDGQLTINVTAGAASDAAGNLSTMASEAAVFIDSVNPTVLSIDGLPASFTSQDAISVTFVFSEPVSNFTVDDIDTSGGSAGAFMAIADDTYTADITPNGNGDLVITIAAGAVMDAVGNLNVDVAQAIVTNALDAEVPIMTLITIASNNANPAFAKTGDIVTIRMTSNEDILTPVVTIRGAPADTVTGSGTNWEATRTMLETDIQGTVPFTINFEDIGGNAGSPLTLVTEGMPVVFDRTAPTLSLSVLPDPFTTLDAITVSFQFTEDVSGFDLGDIDMAVTNGLAENFASTDAQNYTAEITPDGNGDLTISVAANAAADAAGNGSTAVVASATPDLQPFWQLVWSDEFEDTMVDDTIWTKRTASDCPPPCDGVQSYSANNVSVANGLLTIQAQENAGSVYVSGLIDTRGKRELKYGRIEIVAKMPGTTGSAPSLWMLPATDAYGAWPQSGEIDIANAPNLDGINNVTLEHTLRYGLPSPEDTTTTGMYDALNAPDATFLTYALEWEAGEMRWFVDGVHVLTQTQDNWYAYSEDADGIYTLGTDDAPFNEDFYLLLSLAVGDNADVTSMFPQTLQIDSVRVFQCANPLDPAAGTGCSMGDSSVMPVVSPNAPSTEMLEVYTDATAVLSLDGTTNALAAGFAGMVNLSDTAFDDGGNTVWRVNIDAPSGTGEVFIGSQDFSMDPLIDTGFDLTGAETAGELIFDMRVNTVTIGTELIAKLDSGSGNAGEMMLPMPAETNWHTYSVKFADLLANQTGGGLDLSNVVNLFALEASNGTVELDLDNIRVKVACRDTGSCQPAARITTIDYMQDFEALIPDEMMIPNTLSNDGWKVGANVFTPDGLTYLYNYFSFPSPNGGPAFSGVATGQGGAEQGLNQLSVYNDYNNGQHAQGNRIEANVFRVRPITADDAGKIFYFSVDAKRGNINDPGGDTTAAAFIKIIDQGNNLVVTENVDTTDLPTSWNRFTVSVTVPDDNDNDDMTPPIFTGWKLEYGFLNTASFYEPSGVFYDNIEVRTGSAAAP